MKTILCPFHQETTPSCVVYSSRFKCRTCGKRGTIAQLNRRLEMQNKARG